MVGKYFVLGWFSYVFPYHETGLLKWLPANEGCPAKSEVPLVGFCTRLYCDNLDMSEGYLLLPNTARLMSRLSQYKTKSKVFMTCSCLVHDLFTTCSSLAHHLFITCSGLVLTEMVTDIQGVHDLFMICLQLVHYSFI